MQGLTKVITWLCTGLILQTKWIRRFLITLHPESYLQLPGGFAFPHIGVAQGPSNLLVILRRPGVGFLGVTGLLGQRGLIMLLGQGLLCPQTLRNSLQRSELTSLFPGLMDAWFWFWKHPG